MRFFLIISVFSLLACSAFRQAPPATVGSGIPIGSRPNPYPQQATPAVATPNTATQQDFGVVKCHSSQATQFNNQVRNFLSTSADPNQAQYLVKCANTPQWKGGFFIKGKVYFDGQKFSAQSRSQNLAVSQNSYLEIHIVSTTGRPVTPTIKMQIEPFASAVRGQDATLVFQDNKGKVFLNGTVAQDEKNGLLFSGTFEFQNFTAWNGSSQGLSGTIGTFAIPACRFFDCAQTLPQNLQ